MSIADKLVQIAENEPKIYNKGKADGHKEGYSEGHTEGLTEGYNDGYSEGHTAGVTEGYNNGYTEGKTFGYELGYSDGAVGGYEAGKTEGIEQGKQAEYNAFWNSVKENQTALWFYVFAGFCWNDDTFNPPFDLVVPYCAGLFYQSKITDLKGILERNGVKLDFSKATRLQSLIEQSTITRLGVIDTRSCDALQNFLYNGEKLVSVDEIILKDDGTQTISNIGFNLCKSLEEIRFSGVIGAVNWSFKDCPLSVESVKSIISRLKDYSGTSNEYKYTVTFNDDCWAALEADSTAPTGTTWVEYVSSLGWNT